jgi:hypothetical protein
LVLSFWRRSSLTRFSLALGWFLLACLIAFVTPLLRNAIEFLGEAIFVLGNGIHVADPLKDYLLGWTYALLILGSLAFWPVAKEHKILLVRFWILRCFVTLVVMLFYERYFTLDAFDYFFESRFAEFRYPLLLSNNWIVMNYITWWLNQHLMIADSFHAMKVVFAFTGFLGSYLLYLGLVPLIRRESISLFILLQAMPSMLFWSSTLGKDPLNFLGVCLCCYGVMAWVSPSRSVSRLNCAVLVAAGIALAYLIRPWSGKILILPMVLVMFASIRFKLIRWAGIAAIPVLGYQVLQEALQGFGVESTEQFVSLTHGVSRSWSRGGSAMQAPDFHSLGDILSFLPLGMFTALFRPLPGEINSVFGILAGVENLILLLFLVRGVKLKWDHWHATPQYEKTVIYWSAATLVAWAAIYGFVSYQNLGAAFRFRLQATPMLLILLIFLNRRGRLTSSVHSLEQERRG